MFNPFFGKTERMRRWSIAIAGAALMGWGLVLLLGPPLLGVSLYFIALSFRFLADWMNGTGPDDDDP
ncbi:hypothetical protein J2X04_000887 [Lysobacter niabensis]|uniref:Uncharacterized protein n=1 Tax=Agrilutibacter niabensis TaxID=380628 RepID=A0ABU1VMI1_9GAMM|nr:hypothetical protein [Lysobacter niabensis]MDR7098540.1 hypothetical protein [Lysobacter niabensis]